MKIDKKKPPRTFKVGIEQSIEVSDCGSIHLDTDEQVTFKTDSGTEFDFTKKSWGYYVTPSLNSRLTRFNLRCVLIKNIETLNYFVLAVEKGKENDFNQYLKDEGLSIVTWLDDQKSLEQLDQLISKS